MKKLLIISLVTLLVACKVYRPISAVPVSGKGKISKPIPHEVDWNWMEQKAASFNRQAALYKRFIPPVPDSTARINPLTNRPFGTKRYLTNQGAWGAFYDGSGFTYNPGDTLVFKNSNAVVTMALQNFHGTLADTLYVTNETGETSNLPTMILRGCSYVKVTGSANVGTFYGLTSDNTFSGIDVDGQSHNILIERIKLTNGWYSFRLKQDGSCFDSLNYPAFHMHDVTVQDTWSENMNADVMYIGNTAPTSGRVVQECPGKLPYPIPMRLANFYIYRNIIKHAGRTGIQVSGLDSGNCIIKDNDIDDCGQENSQSQGSGIILGGMTQNTLVSNNKIRRCFQFGIYDIGYSRNGSIPNKIENNDIDSCGMIPMTETDKVTVVNTDTSYRAARCYFYNMGENTTTASTIRLIATKNSGTANGYAFVVGKSFLDNPTAWPMSTENTFPSDLHPISDTFYFSNTTTQQHDFQISQTTQFAKIIIKQTGTQNMTYSGIVINNWYAYSIGVGTRDTYPAGDSATYWIRNNKLGDIDNTRGGKNISIGDGAYYKNGDKRICGNITQRGDTASRGVSPTALPYSTDCSSSTQFPSVTPGPNQTVTTPTTSATFAGDASSPNGSIVSHTWAQLAGPNTATITTPSNYNSTVTGLIVGVYTFRLSVVDNIAATGSATMTITVTNPANHPPTAIAGADQTITLPITTVALSGSGIDDDGTIASYSWQKLSGSGSLINSPTSATTLVTGLIQDQYVFRLTVTDNSGSVSSDDIVISVQGLPGKKIRPIIVDKTKVFGTQYDFPVLVADTFTYLKRSNLGGSVSSLLGYDINFCRNSNGTGKLSWDIEKYDNATGYLVAWVKLDSIHASKNDTFYITYHDTVTVLQTNPKDVWTNKFAFVAHVGSVDATIGNFNGAVTGALTATGKIGDATDMSAIRNDRIEFGDGLGISDSMTLTGWVKPINFGWFEVIMGKMTNNYTLPYSWTLGGGGFGVDGYLNFQRGSGFNQNNIYSSTGISAGVWSYISVTVSGDNIRHYKNGALNGTGTLNASGLGRNGVSNFIIGNNDVFNNPMHGSVDELRVTTTPRSDNWISTEYSNQSAPTSFSLFGSESTLPGAPRSDIRIRGRFIRVF